MYHTGRFNQYLKDDVSILVVVVKSVSRPSSCPSGTSVPVHSCLEHMTSLGTIYTTFIFQYYTHINNELMCVVDVVDVVDVVVTIPRNYYQLQRSVVGGMVRQNQITVSTGGPQQIGRAHV